ncbi:TetR/AcrR family transcriptional regulator [Mycobacteroides chelonae]|uniref:TetR/AcrR family transcriptional regulator n=1 Tax=Mycobacteroides chelonae TaxID=1774 RepID=A0AB73U4B7_MYCCH|nr:TetR/AcrR family transcriptional regulator [Mycobacteroides chelonae]
MIVAQHGDKEARRREILDAGRAVLRSGGLAGMQMREVARRAGVALGTLYTYFATKESLYAALYSEAVERFFLDMEPLLEDRAVDPEELFVAFANGQRTMYAEYGRELDLFTMLGSKSGVDQLVLERLIQATTRMTSAFRKLLADRNIDNPDLALVVLWSTATGLAEHFTGPRHAFHGLSWDETVRYAASVLTNNALSSTPDSSQQ